MNRVEIKKRQAGAFSVILALITMAVISRVMGENGVAYIVAALEIWGFLWIVISGGVSDTLGRLLRGRNARGQYKNAVKLKKSVMLFQVILGAAGSLFLLFGAESLAGGLFQMQYSTFILMVLAPAIFLRTVSEVLLGYFQGEGSELPTAASGILRQIFILGFGMLFGRMLGNYGDKVSKLLLQENFSSMYGGVGIALAVDFAEVFIILFLFLVYKANRQPKERLQEDGMRFTNSFFDSMRIFFAGRGLPLLIQLLIFLPLPIGLLFLQKATENRDAAALEYGVYLSSYLVVGGIIAAMIYILVIPVVGKVFVHLKKEEQRFARTGFQSGVHMIVVHGAFWAVLLTVLAAQISALLSPEQADTARKMFAGGSATILFAVLGLYFGSVLRMIGRKGILPITLAVSDVVFVVALTMMLNGGKMGVPALVYAGLSGSGCLCVLLGVFAYRQLKCRFDWLQVLVLPMGAAAVSGLLMMFLGKILTPHVGNLVTLIVAAVITGIIYWVLLLVLRNFKEQEFEVISGGRILNSIARSFRIF